jgi:hypothetical protein
MRRLVVLAIALHASVARADDSPSPEPPPADQASGIEREPRSPARLRWIPRALLFIPRWVVWGVSQPLRGAAYAYERYELPKKWRDTFFSEDGAFGIFPTTAYETGFGLTGGARLVHRDLFGEGERLKLRAGFGGRFRQAYGVNVRSGRRIPKVALELDGSFERRPNEPFYGIGDDAMPQEVRFEEDVVRTIGRVDIPIVGPLALRLSGAVMLRDLMGTSVNNTRVEGELVYDSRRPSTIYASRVLDATGWLASIHGGATRGIGDDPSRFASYGGEVQRYFDLYRGTRVLTVRVVVETIDGTASFIDLPRLGGTELLRGYPAGRFRDRAFAVGSIEYTWELGNFLAAYLFVDAGRVWPSLADFALGDQRTGFGGGIQAHTTASYLGRLQLAGSRDGDFIVELVLSPAFRRRERVGRF